MANEIQFGYTAGKTLTYKVDQPDGTPRTTSTSLPEVSDGHYAADDANIVAGDMQIAYQGTNEIGQGVYQPESTVVNLASIAASVWDALTSSITTVGSIGVWILEKLDVVVSTRASLTRQTSMQLDINSIVADVDGLNGEAMRGTDDAATEAKQDAGDVVRNRSSAIQEGDEDFDFANGTVEVFPKGTTSGGLLKKTLYDKDDVLVADTEAIISRTEDVTP